MRTYLAAEDEKLCHKVAQRSTKFYEDFLGGSS
jgi:hypothetical protein